MNNLVTKVNKYGSVKRTMTEERGGGGQKAQISNHLDSGLFYMLHFT